jgi:hypothetical protein
MEADAYTRDVLAAQEAVARYWAIVDGNLNAPIESCFVDDCFMKIDNLEILGRSMLIDAVNARTAKAVEQGRSTRHLISNFFVRSHSGDALVLDSLITVFSGYGDKPAQLGPPSSIGDFTYSCIRTGTGAWRISRLEGAIVFAGGDSPFARRAASR